MRSSFLLSLLLPLAAAGCFPSLHPLYEQESDTLFLEELIGTWKHSKNTEESIWEFQKNDFGYRLIVTDRMEEGTTIANLEAHVVKIGDRLFLDTYPAETEGLDQLSSLYLMHMVPAHLFWQIEVDQDSLHLRLLDVTSDRFKLSHEELEDEYVVVTASTHELKAALQDQIAAEPALSDEIVFQRLPQEFGPR